MFTRPQLPVLALAFALAACDAGITAPSFLHLSSLSPAGAFACGLDAEGRAFCWGGDNSVGQLGSGADGGSAIPMAVKSGARFTQVVTGWSHACALATDGRAFCWGDNASSELGISTTDLDCTLRQSNGFLQDFGNACSVVPVPVQTELRFVRLGASDTRTCGLTGSGTLWCWGVGLLGDSAGTGRSDTPIRVSSSAKFVTFAMGSGHSCAADTKGLGWCWGANWYGQLGLGALGGTSSGSVPARINSSAYLRGFAVGSYHTCALTSARDVLCWGYGASGQRGDSSFTDVSVDPVYVKTDRRFSAVAAAGNRTCALEAGTGAAWCWGENSDGLLGEGTTSDRFAPAPVLGALSYRGLVMGTFPGIPDAAICGVGGTSVYCWGLVPEPLTFEE